MIMKKRRLLYISAICASLLLSSCGASGEATDAAIVPSNGGSFGADGGTFAADEYSYAAEEEYAAVDDSVGEAEIGGLEVFEAGDKSGEKLVDETKPYETFEIIEEYPRFNYQAGLLTAGEWNDNENFDFWTNLITTRQDEWNSLPSHWNLSTLNRVAVNVTNGDTPAENVTVKLYSGNTMVWEAVTDNNVNAYLFNTLSSSNQYVPTKITTERGGQLLTEVEFSQGAYMDYVNIDVEAKKYGGDILDLMFVVDTTGSMGDELAYLQAELQDIVKRVTDEKQIPVRLSVNFYRDSSDDYVVKDFDFTVDIDEAVRNLNQQYASGGGDYEEAVEVALDVAINGSTWQEGNTKLMFLILDAPPHYNDNNAVQLASLLETAAAQGIRIIPVASSGVDTETEFLCRTFAIATGGTYTFLTDHSGVGGSHLEPTVGQYQVEKLNDMIVRIIESYL